MSAAVQGAFDPGAPYPSPNPFIAAAAPLLILLGHARRERAAPAIDDVAAAIRHFEQRIAASGARAEEARIAAFALCESADDIARTLPGAQSREWTHNGMLATFFRTQATGTGFFEALNRQLANPAPHVELIELMHACLSLGFEGQYRGRADAHEGLRRVRFDVYETLRHLRPPPPADIAPRWRGARQKAKSPRLVLFWALVTGAPVLAAAVYLALSHQIESEGDAAVARLLAFSPDTAVVFDRAVLAPPPSAVAPPPEEQAGPERLERVRAALAADIAAGALTVAPRGGEIVVTIDNALLFGPGKAEVRPEFAPVAGRIAALLDTESGPVTVVGHTDNLQPGRGSAYPSNAELSVARARTVEDVIATAMADPSRLAVEGKGDEEPIADNATPEGRAANRRVELVMPREAAP